jgi:diguanylate cyclase (GGDEF)-like protein
MTTDTSAATTDVVADDPLSRIAGAIRETLPGQPGETLLARIADIVASPLPEGLEELALENARLHEELAQAAATDAATGLRNRRRFFEDLRREFASARRYETPLSLVVLAVDDLRDGGQAMASGDDLMRSLAETLLTQLRVTDISARVGDADLAVILPQTPTEGAGRVAARLAAVLPVAVSTGTATLTADVTSAAELLERASRDLDGAR